MLPEKAVRAMTEAVTAVLHTKSGMNFRQPCQMKKNVPPSSSSQKKSTEAELKDTILKKGRAKKA